MTLTEFTEKLVPISDFSKGKAGKIFTDVEENNNEYIVLRNNQPTAVLISIKEYRRKPANWKDCLKQWKI